MGLKTDLKTDKNIDISNSLEKFKEISETLQSIKEIIGKKIYHRKLIKLGNSLAITIPQEILHKLKLLKGSDVLLCALDEKNLIIHF